MTETRTGGDLGVRMRELAAVQRLIDERDILYAQRADLFLELSEMGVTQAQLGKATGTSMQAVGQNIARARARREPVDTGGKGD